MRTPKCRGLDGTHFAFPYLPLPLAARLCVGRDTADSPQPVASSPPNLQSHVGADPDAVSDVWTAMSPTRERDSGESQGLRGLVAFVWFTYYAVFLSDILSLGRCLAILSCLETYAYPHRSVRSALSTCLC